MTKIKDKLKELDSALDGAVKEQIEGEKEDKFVRPRQLDAYRKKSVNLRSNIQFPAHTPVLGAVFDKMLDAGIDPDAIHISELADPSIVKADTVIMCLREYFIQKRSNERVKFHVLKNFRSKIKGAIYVGKSEDDKIYLETYDQEGKARYTEAFITPSTAFIFENRYIRSHEKCIAYCTEDSTCPYCIK